MTRDGGTIDPPYCGLTVGALPTRLAAALPGHEALVYAHRGLRLTFAELEAEARLIARGLMACGVARGERVALWAHNVPEWIVLQFALAKIGAILVTVHTAVRAHEIDYLLRQCEAATLVTVRGFKHLDYLGIRRRVRPAGARARHRHRRRPACGSAARHGVRRSADPGACDE